MRTIFLALAIAAFGCASTDGNDGSDGTDGSDGADGANGSNGSNGSDGKNSLLRLDDEPIGSHCANGGKAVHSGVDDNGDGTLQDGEIENTAYICNAPDGRPSGVVEGSLKITSSIDRNLLVNVTEITGNLEVHVLGMPTFALPKLERVGGMLVLLLHDTTTLDLSALESAGWFGINAPALTSLAGLSSLTTVDSSLHISNCDALQTLAGLEQLETIGEDIYIADNETLTTLAAIAGVTTVGGEVRIESNAALTTIGAFNSLTSIEAIVLYGNPELTTLNAFAELVGVDWIGVAFSSKLATFTLPKLESADGISFEYVSGVQTVSFPALLAVGDMLRLLNNADITSLSAPQLASVGQLIVDSNAAITSFDLGALTTLGWGEIVYNESLATCQATAIANQLVNFEGSLDIIGNDDAGACP